MSENEKVDLLDILLDQDNKDPIVLNDANGNELRFEQVAIITYEISSGEKSLYCILKPLDHIDGIADDGAIVFLVDHDEQGYTVLRVEQDMEIAQKVFDKYYDLLAEARRNKNEN